MAKMWHKGTIVVSMFQNGISQNTKCAVKDGFHGDSHICSCYLTSLCGLCVGICAGEPIMLVMELVKLGPLNKYLKSHSNSVTIATISLFMSQVCEVRTLCVHVCLCVCACAHMYMHTFCIHMICMA